MAETFRLWFIGLFALAIVGFVTQIIRFRTRRDAIEKRIGPVPTPVPFVSYVVALVVLLTGAGDMSVGLPILRAVGVALSVYAIVMLPWAARTLGASFAPGIAVMRKHALVTSGPYRLTRHPLYSAVLALWLGAALGTMNWILIALSPLVIAGLSFASRSEEGLLRAKFGTDYETYAAKTARFIPAVW